MKKHVDKSLNLIACLSCEYYMYVYTYEPLDTKESIQHRFTLFFSLCGLTR